MKLKYLISFLLPVLLTSCNSKALKRPKETNLEVWITEQFQEEKVKNMTYLPTWFGAKEYLGSNYEGNKA